MLHFGLGEPRGQNWNTPSSGEACLTCQGQTAAETKCGNTIAVVLPQEDYLAFDKQAGNPNLAMLK